VFLVGGGNSAGQSALFLSHYAQSVTLLVRGSTLATTMSQYLIEQIAGRANVRVETMTELAAVSGVDRLKRVRTVCRGEKVVERPADVLQVMIGSNAVTGWLPATLQRDPHGFICTGSEVTDLTLWGGERRPLLLETSFPGLFCAGDVRCGSVKRVSSAVGEGSVVISMVHRFLAQKAKL
jgi:thioredoxin reductase (NADPH)